MLHKTCPKEEFENETITRQLCFSGVGESHDYSSHCFWKDQHENDKSAFSNLSGLENINKEKLLSHDGLVWTVGLTVEK